MKPTRTTLPALLVALLFVPGIPFTSVKAAEAADLLVHNGTIATIDSGFSTASSWCGPGIRLD